MHRSNAGFSIIQLMICVIIMGILASIGIPQYREWRRQTQRTAIEQQARAYNDAISAWVIAQPTLNQAIKQFSAAENGTTKPKDIQGFISQINSRLTAESDLATMDGNGHYSTEAMRQYDAYFDVRWPTPCRDFYPRVVLSMP